MKLPYVRSLEKKEYYKQNRERILRTCAEYRKKNPLKVFSNEVRLRRLETSAKSKNRDFDISQEFFNKNLEKNCYYCNKPPEVYFGGYMDRVDSSKGYTQDNVVPCCFYCNRSKGKMTQSEFYEHVEKMYKTIKDLK